MVVSADAEPRRLIDAAELVHRIVIGVGDVCAPLWVEGSHDEVEQVTV